MVGSVPISSVPHFLVAATPSELQRLCILNNLKTGIVFKYFDFAELQDGTHICWYFHDIHASAIVKSEQAKELEKKTVGSE